MIDGKPVDILLVEDNEADVELMLRAFKKNNLSHQVSVVGDGVEALDFVFARGKYAGRNIAEIPRVILLDLKLPKVNGLEVVRRLKADSRMKKIPIVVVSSSREEPDIRGSYELGVNSYLVKPVDFVKFVEAISAVALYWLLLNEPSR